MKLSLTILLISTALLVTPFLWAMEPLSLKLANMSQDVTAVGKEIAQLRLEIESLARENQVLKKQIEDLSATESQIKKQTAQINALSSTFEAYKKTMLTEVAVEIDQLSRQTQKAIDQLAQSIASNHEAPKNGFKFTDDYGKEGLAYTVKPGETISIIALQQGSTTRDIQNANRIADPRELKAGQVIFIPTKK